MAVGFSNTNKPLNPRGNDASPKGYNRASLFSGKALDFDGVNDNISFPLFNFTAGNKYSLCIYANRDDNGMIWSASNQFVEIKFVSGALQLRTYDTGWNTYTLIDDVPANEWHQIIVTYDVNANIWESYLNGQFVKSITAAAVLYSRINRIGSAVSTFYDGEFANAKIFDVALTAAQVADLYNNPEKVVPTGVDNTALKLWLPMMEGAGTTAYDGSGNGNHGTISGATYVNGIGAPVAQSAVMDWNKGSNLKSHSEDISNGYTLQNLTLLQDNTTSPNGLDNADKIVETTTATKVFYSEQTSQSAGKYTTSLFVKTAERGFAFAQIAVDSATNRYGVAFDLSDGSFGSSNSVGSPTGTSYDISDAGNGWYRISVTATHTSGSVYGIYGTSNSATPTFNVSGYPSYAGDTTKGLFVWGYQIEKADSVGPYIPTISAQTSEVLLPQGLTTGRDITGVNLFENVRKQGALNLDGNSWAEVNDNASVDLTTALTLEAWVYNDGNETFKGVLSKWASAVDERCFMLYKQDVDDYRFDINGTSLNTGAAVASGWNHLVGVWDSTSTNKYFYVNGALSASTTQSVTINTSDNPVEIGTYGYTSANSFNNQIAQPRIYNRALTAAEVLQNYNSGKNTYTND